MPRLPTRWTLVLRIWRPTPIRERITDRLSSGLNPERLKHSATTGAILG